ncbi:hypothetical protein CK203_038179 [Vitis vinifera]|uniref:Uncharacterized protein n=1 Tax=Vitis vinifera TaxID=29760 RepID=A0A438IBI6_VITVI|nr:hypothetical protein CK203_038179 [Vitis vinifera]
MVTNKHNGSALYTYLHFFSTNLPFQLSRVPFTEDDNTHSTLKAKIVVVPNQTIQYLITVYSLILGKCINTSAFNVSLMMMVTKSPYKRDPFSILHSPFSKDNQESLHKESLILLTIDKGGKEDRGAITAENQDTPRRLAGKYMANQQIGTISSSE